MKKLIICICGGVVLFAAHATAMEYDARHALVPASSAMRPSILAVTQEDADQQQQRVILSPFTIYLGPIKISPRAGADALVCGTMWLANLANRNGWFTQAWEGARHLGRSIKQTIRHHPVISGVLVATLAGAAVTTMGYAHS